MGRWTSSQDVAQNGGGVEAVGWWVGVYDAGTGEEYHAYQDSKDNRASKDADRLEQNSYARGEKN